jgi:hypothetical protein
MPTSGVYTQTKNAEYLIKGALSICGVQDRRQPLSAGDFADSVTVLNDMLKHFQKYKKNLWRYWDCVLLPQLNVRAYTLGTTAKCCFQSQFLNTTLTANITNIATIIPLASVGSLIVGGQLGLYNSNTQSFIWRTITNISTLNVTINSTFGLAASSGNIVYGYNSTIPAVPDEIVDAQYYDQNNSTIKMNRISRQDDWNYPIHNISGINLTYSGTREPSGYITKLLFPIADEQNYIQLQLQRETQLFISPQDEVDFRDIWNLPIMWNLAGMLGILNHIPDAKQQMIDARADSYLREALSNDTDAAPLRIVYKSLDDGY